MYELIYTSAPRGLIPGRSGFATVAMTEGMPPNLIVPLENLSGYNFTLRDNTFQEPLNPPCCYYIKMRYGNQILHAAGRVAPNGLDYSQRNNKIAHHLLFESPEELDVLPGGAAGLFLQEGVFRNAYTEEPTVLPFRKVPACTLTGKLPAKNWAALTGHAGFAALAAERFRDMPEKPLYLIYPPGISTDKLLNLVLEVTALLDEEIRKYFTFSTYFGSSSASVDCFLRMLPDFSPMAGNLRRFHQSDIIELGQINELPPSESYSAVYEYACTGKKPEKPQIITAIQIDQQLPETVEFAEEETRQAMQPSGTAPVFEVLPPPEINYRKFVLAGTAAVIAAAVAMLLLFDMPAKTAVPSEKTLQKNVQKHTASKKSTEQPQSEKEEKVILSSVKAADTAVAQIQQATVKPLSTNKKNQSKISMRKTAAESTLFDTPSLRAQAQPMPLPDALDLFVNFIGVNKNSQHNIKLELPRLLHGVKEIYPVMQKIGTGRHIDNRFISRGIRLNEVCVRAAEAGSLPLRPLNGAITDTPHLEIKISENGKFLLITEYSTGQRNCIMPEFTNIKQLYFRMPDKVYVWHNKFQKGYLALLKPGKITIDEVGHTFYQPGKTETVLGSQIVTKVGNYYAATFCSSSFYFDKWNRAVQTHLDLFTQAEKLKKQIRKMAKKTTNSAGVTKLRAIMESIRQLAVDGDENVTDEEFTRFLDNFFDPAAVKDIPAAELDDFAKQLHKELADSKLDKKQQKKIADLLNQWLKKINKVEKFQQLQKTLISNNKKLSNSTEDLLNARSNTLQTAQNIHRDIEKLLKALITDTVKTPGSAGYKFIREQERNILSKAIREKITFEPIIFE